MSHSSIPTANNMSIPGERSLQDFVRHALYTWGRKATVVQNPAI